MGTTQIDRRTLAKGVAWSLPAVAVASAAPAYAASPQTPACSLTVTAASGTKDTSDKSVTFTLTITNLGESEQTVTILGLSGPTNTPWTVDQPILSVAPGEHEVTFTATRRDNADGDCVITLTACGQPQTVTAPISR